MRTFTCLEDLWREVRHAVRYLRRSPGHTTAIVILLALGIGANAAMFNLVNVVFIRELPVPEPDRLVVLTATGSWPTATFEDFRRLQNSFSGIVGVGSLTYSLVTTDGGELLANARGGIVSGNYFRVLGVRPALGRVLTEDDDRLDDPQPVMVISHNFWRRQFGGDPQTLGRRLHLFGSPFTIVGITPPEFAGEMPGRVRDFWVPLNMQPVANPEGDLRRNRTFRWLSVIGRLKPDVVLEQAQAEAEVVYRQVLAEQAASQPDTLPQQRSRTTPIHMEPGNRGFGYFRRQFRTQLQILAGTVGIVLLIVCANVAALLLARGAGREREFAVRQALGCGRARLVRQLFLEGLLLAGAGGAIGLALAPASARGLLWLQPGMGLAGFDLSPDPIVLAFVAGIGVLTAVVFSLAPALRASRAALEPALKSASRGTTGLGSRRRIIRGVLSFQTALSVVLVAASVLFAQTLFRLNTADVGFDRDHLVSVTINARLAGYQDDGEFTRLGQRLIDRVSALPGVKSASIGLCAVLMGCSRAAIVTVDGHPPQPEDPPIWINPVSRNYFETAGMPIVMGRGFGAQDRPGSAGVAVVTEALARFYFPGQSALGKRFRERSTGRQGSVPIEIVGVVRDVRFVNPRDAPIRMAFLSLDQFPGPFGYLQARTEGPPGALIPALRHAILEVDPKLRMLGPETPHASPRDVLLARAAGLFGAIALSLACFGVYGVISYLVAARRAELGIRLAIGAQPSEVLRLVLADTLRTVAPGLAVGIVGAWAAGRLVESLLFGVTRNDPLTYLAVAATLLLTTVLAAYVPALRASRIDPVTALRCE